MCVTYAENCTSSPMPYGIMGAWCNSGIGQMHFCNHPQHQEQREQSPLRQPDTIWSIWLRHVASQKMLSKGRGDWEFFYFFFFWCKVLLPAGVLEISPPSPSSLSFSFFLVFFSRPFSSLSLTLCLARHPFLLLVIVYSLTNFAILSFSLVRVAPEGVKWWMGTVQSFLMDVTP